MLISSGFQALSNISYMSGPHQHRVRLADNKIIFIMLVSSEVWAGGYFATISPDWSLLQNGRWTGCWASLCCVIPISREENNQQCDRYSSASGALRYVAQHALFVSGNSSHALKIQPPFSILRKKMNKSAI